jgi:hypothetical protein
VTVAPRPSTPPAAHALFEISALGWTDPEGHLPLRYAYSYGSHALGDEDPLAVRVAEGRGLQAVTVGARVAYLLSEGFCMNSNGLPRGLNSPPPLPLPLVRPPCRPCPA